MTSKKPCNYRHLHTPPAPDGLLDEPLEIVLTYLRVEGHPGEHFAFTDHYVFWEAKPHLVETD